MTKNKSKMRWYCVTYKVSTPKNIDSKNGKIIVEAETPIHAIRVVAGKVVTNLYSVFEWTDIHRV